MRVLPGGGAFSANIFLKGPRTGGELAVWSCCERARSALCMVEVFVLRHYALAYRYAVTD